MHTLPSRYLSLLLVSLPLSACTEPVATPSVDEPLQARIEAGPQVLYTGGHVVTVDPIARVDEAILIQGSRIAATGPSYALRAIASSDAVEIDLAGRTVVPGFIDPHNHIYNQVFLQQDTERWGATYGEAEQILLEAGWTSIANGNVWPDATADFVSWVEAEGLRVRTSIYLAPNDFCGEDWPVGWYLAYPPITDPEAMFRIPGLKLFTDGGACNRASYSFYADGGDLYLDAQQVATVVSLAESQGYHLLVHAIGDRAIVTTLDGFELAGGRGHLKLRHRIDHVRWVPPDQRARFGGLGITPVHFAQTPTCSIVLPNGGWRGLLREENAPLRPWFDPIRAMVEDNPQIRVSAKSDTPFFRLPAMENLWSLVTRDVIAAGGPAEGQLCEAPEFLEATGLDVETAIEVLTVNAAHALGVEDAVGTLKPGKLADLLVLSANPLEVPPEALRHIDVLMTMVGGRAEHCAEGAGELCAGGGPS